VDDSCFVPPASYSNLGKYCNLCDWKE
jgi:hypothetical protein